MLEGMAANDIIVGAYSTGEGICPMLAAHRNGGRTSLIAFAEAWDRVAFRGQREARARRATEREILILRSHLEASLLEDDLPVGEPAVGEPAVSELARARRDHEALVTRREHEAASARPAHEASPARPEHEALPARRERPGEPDRTHELERRPGWAWTRVVRRYDEYERIIQRVEDATPAAPPASLPAAGR
ncbi:MAG TPA: hypothetical protein VMF14_16565 [Solirubrobacteraceae bacterium]|nr:hypothetical protein [Solirubrobacteraceae bacterium]